MCFSTGPILPHIAREARCGGRSLLHLANEKGLSPSTRNVAWHALRFFFLITLRRHWTIESIPSVKEESRLPVILSQEEVQRLMLLQRSPLT